MAVDYDLGTARGKIEIDSSQLGRTSQALGSVGKSLIGLGVIAASGFIVAVKSAADFEKQISAVAAVSQASGKDVEKLRQLALNLGSSTTFSAGEIAKAMEALAKAGIPVQDMLNGATTATIHLAAAAGDELPGGVERAAEVIANAQKVFGAGADELEHFADVLVAAAASSTLNVDDLATSMKYAGPIAAELGLTIDDLSTVLAILGDRGIKGSIAGTSLRGVLLSLTPSSVKAAKAMKELGLITADGANQFYDMHGNLKPIPEVMDLLAKATAGLSEQEKVTAFNAIFQRRAMNSALILAQQGKKGFTDYAKAIGALKASDIAATKLDNLSGDITKLRNSFNALMIRAGEPFQKMVRGWVQGLTGLLSKLQKLNPETIKTIVQIAAIAGVVLIAVGSILLLSSYMLRAYRTFLILKEGIVLVTSAMKLLTVSFLTNPVFLIIAAIVLLAAVLFLAYKRSDTFRAAFDKAFDHFQPTIEAVVGWVQNFVSLLDDLWKAFKTGGIEGKGFSDVLDKMGLNSDQVVKALVFIRDTFRTLRNAAVTAFDYFANVILPALIDFGYGVVHAGQTATKWITQTAVPAIVGFGKAVGRVAASVASWFNDHVMPVLSAFGSLVLAVVSVVVKAIMFIWPAFVFVGDVIAGALGLLIVIITGFVKLVLLAWSYLGDNIISLIVITFNFIKGIVEGALKIIEGIFDVFAGLLTLNWSQVWDGIKEILNGIWKIIVTIVQTAIDLVVLIVQTAVDLIVIVWKTAWDFIPKIFTAAWNFFLGLLNAGVQLVQAIFHNIWALISGIWSGLWDLLKNILSAAWRGIVETIVRNVASVISKMLNLKDRIIGLFLNAVSWLVTAGKNIIQGLLNGVTDLTGKLINFVGSIAGKVRDALGNFGHLLFDKGKALIQGLIDGIKSMFGKLGDVAGDVAHKIGGFLPGSPVKEGPLTVLNRGHAGSEIVKMLMKGMMDESKNLAAKMSQVAAITSNPLALSAPAGSVSRGDHIEVNFHISGMKDAAQVRTTLADTGVLTQIMSAVKAGRR